MYLYLYEPFLVCALPDFVGHVNIDISQGRFGIAALVASCCFVVANFILLYVVHLHIIPLTQTSHFVPHPAFRFVAASLVCHLHFCSLIPLINI